MYDASTVIAFADEMHMHWHTHAYVCAYVYVWIHVVALEAQELRAYYGFTTRKKTATRQELTVERYML